MIYFNSFKKHPNIFLCNRSFGYVMSFLVAWVINELKFRKAFALAFYAPSITSGIAMSVVWLYFFSSDRYGFVNNLLINLGIILEPIMWNLNSKTIMPVIMIVSVWMSMGTGFLVTLAGLQNVPRELYEAGRIDGIHSRFQELWYITIPMITPQLLFTAINTIVDPLGYLMLPCQLLVCQVPIMQVILLLHICMIMHLSGFRWDMHQQ